MANNRMYLVCTECVNTSDVAIADCLFYFAKYYPSTGWYTNANVHFQEEIDDWFDQHKHGTLFGQFVTMFESELNPDALAANNILQALQTHTHAINTRAKKLEG